tara:strand:- start:682 stop:1155 length:474 start_codon:yes stop_codon:yes gene_type:complete
MGLPNAAEWTRNMYGGSPKPKHASNNQREFDKFGLIEYLSQSTINGIQTMGIEEFASNVFNYIGRTGRWSAHRSRQGDGNDLTGYSKAKLLAKNGKLSDEGKSFNGSLNGECDYEQYYAGDNNKFTWCYCLGDQWSCESAHKNIRVDKRDYIPIKKK